MLRQDRIERRQKAAVFLRRCGSPLFVTGEGEAGKVWGIRWGSIAQRAALTPRRQIWCRSALPFAQDISGLPKIETS